MTKKQSHPKLFIAGHHGMVGSAIVRELRQLGHPEENIVTRDRDDLDLTNQQAVETFFKTTPIDQVYLCAAKVGGIFANNTYPAEFIYSNLMIQCNVIASAHRHGVKKLLFLGSSCIYPRGASQPMVEDALMTGPLEPTNEPYAIAKIAGIKTCESYNRQYQESHGTDYRSVMPTNLYGINDNYHPENSHVIPGLIRRFHEAKIAKKPSVTVWGSGVPRREFLYVDDMARASILVMNLSKEDYAMLTAPQRSHLNVGFGSDVSIFELANEVAHIVGYQGDVLTDPTKPDGPSQKLMDSSRLMGLGWKPQVGLSQGLALAYEDFLSGEDRQ